MIFMISLLSIIVLILSSSMILINTIISKKSFNDREKSSPFECGFDPSSSPRMPFSLHFFMITVIFLVFDVEITLLIPMIKTMEISNLSSYFWTFSIFILILVSGTLHEWNQGALSWKS